MLALFSREKLKNSSETLLSDTERLESLSELFPNLETFFLSGRNYQVSLKPKDSVFMTIVNILEN